MQQLLLHPRSTLLLLLTIQHGVRVHRPLACALLLLLLLLWLELRHLWRSLLHAKLRHRHA
jgi:hypothetical protein